jgi:hypothetical protein
LTYKLTVLYKSNQNRIAEKTIQYTEADTRIILAEAKLLIEFWDKAAEANIYLQNRIPRGKGLQSETYIFSPEEVFTGWKRQITTRYNRVFGCKYYFYIDPKLLPADRKKDKLILQRYIYIFIKYIDKTTKQYKVYILDLQTIVRASIVDFKEKTKGRTVNLNFLEENLQSIPNVFTVYKPIGRPKGLLIPTVELPPQEKLNNFEIVIPLQIPEGLTETTNISVNLPTKKLQPENPANLSNNQDRIPEQGIFQEQPVTVPEIPVSSLYNLRKYNRSQKGKPDKPDNRVAKQIRAILALLEQEEFDLDNQETVFAVFTKDKEIVQIPIPKSYSKAVTDPVYRPE